MAGISSVSFVCSSPPCSMSKIFLDESSLKRAAKTLPAVPAPTFQSNFDFLKKRKIFHKITPKIFESGRKYKSKENIKYQ